MAKMNPDNLAAFNKGARDRKNGYSQSANPYPMSKKTLRSYWVKGWKRGEPDYRMI